MLIDARQHTNVSLNEMIRKSYESCKIEHCLGERFIGSGCSNKKILIDGVPGNSLGAYLNGAEIEVYGNAQEAVGDTMNGGRIVIHGKVGDTVGYSMRGGHIYVRDDAGYRAGIHMKSYKNKFPVLVIGGNAGSFLGEYQAGGCIIVLGLTDNKKSIVGNFPCYGMHMGKMFLRSNCSNVVFPDNVNVRIATKKDLEEIEQYIKTYSMLFDCDYSKIINSEFTMVVPNSNNPYRQLYVAN